MAQETIVLVLRRGVHESWGTGDAVIISVYIGVCQHMAKLNIGIYIRWTINDADQLSYNKADCM